jgi:hypothetical protein
MLVAFSILGGLVLLFVSWLVAEFRATRAVRVTLGVVTVAACCFYFSLMGTVNSYYTALYHKRAVFSMIRLLENGQSAELRVALDAYASRIGDSDSLSNAAQLMDAVEAAAAADRLPTDGDSR